MAERDQAPARETHGPGPRAFREGKKAKDAKGTIKRLMGYLRQYRGRLMLVAFLILVSAVSGVAGSVFIRVLIDDYIKPLVAAGPGASFRGLLTAILIMAGIYMAGVLSTLFYNRIMVTVAQGVLRDIRVNMFSKMQKLPIKYFDTHSHGDVMSHYTNDTDTLRQMISQSIPNVINSGITIIVVFVAMLVTSVWLTLIVLAFVALMLYVTKKVGGKSSKYFVKNQKSLGAVNGYIEELVSGQKVVKVFCREEAAKKEFDRKNEELAENGKKANIFASILMPIMMNMGNIQYAVLAVAGAALALGHVQQGLTLGAIASFLQLSRTFSRPVNMMAQQTNAVVMALAGTERIFELMDEEPETDNGRITLVNAKFNADGSLTETDSRTNTWAWKCPQEDGSFEYVQVRGDVRFKDVDFSYVEGKPVLNDISLFAKPGQKIAFVGATGAGKTTITNLINRFYDIADGKITYDGININDIKKDDLRHSLGMVLQEVNLFTGTVMENIRYGRLEATDEEVIAAAKLANAHSFISMLPQGYDTVLSGDGSGLSQGQRQLISIARAAVEDPPVMILDEATSSIDTRTEAIVQSGMDALMYGRTVFVIAHRLSTVHNADAILVLDHGSVIERGSHDDLIDLKGEYYALYTGAFELE